MMTPTIDLRTEGLPRGPWVYSKMLRHPRPRPKAGTLVDVRDKTGAMVGRGIYHPHTTLALRILTRHADEPLDADFFRRRLAQAKALREDLLRIPQTSDSYRLVHGEADGLSGVIIDKFAEVLLVEPLSAGYLTMADWLNEALADLYPDARIVWRPDEKIERREGVNFNRLTRQFAPPPVVEVREGDLRMQVDLLKGHKTGYFLDQRDNRRRIAELAGGRKVLDLFCYTGGFAISAALAGAQDVQAVDLDEKALAVARRNARVNRVKVRFKHVNAFDDLRNRIARKERFDLVITDPPKLADTRADIAKALRSYTDLARLACQVVRPGGILLACSCSGLISESQFLGALARGADDAGALLQIFHLGGAAGDHPISHDFPEARYLNATFARILPP
jgi:23S rRNA (cytosine1962-C5)-methyltransferase